MISPIKAYVILAGMIVIMSEIVSVVCVHELYSGFVFAIFQLIGVLLPGTALLLAWGWEKKLDWQACGISFVTGYCFTLFEYFAVMLAGVKEYTPGIVAAVAAISLGYILKKREGKLFGDSDEGRYDQRFILILTGAMFFITLLASCCNNLVPPVVAEGQPTNDLTHWCGNIIELTREIPPKNFFYYPMEFKYHWFSSAQLAFVNFFTDIRPIYLGYYFSAVQSVVLRVLCGYLLLKKCTDSIRMMSLGALLLFFSSGFDRAGVVLTTYMAHQYHASFGVEYGMAMFMLFVVLLQVKYEEKKNQIRTSVLIWICVFIMTGEKVSYAVVGLIGLGVMSTLWLYKREYTKSLLTGLPSILIFIVEYKGIINLNHFVTSNIANAGDPYQWVKPIWLPLLSSPKIIHVQEILDIIHLPIEPFLAVVLVALVSPVCFVAVIYNCWRISKAKAWTLFDISLLVMYMGGVCITVFCKMYGNSNMYFAFGSYVAAIVWLIKCNLPWGDMGKKIFTCAAVVSIIGFCYGYTPTGGTSIVAYFDRGISFLVNGRLLPGAETAYIREHVDNEGFKAYEWIKENTPENCILITNRDTKILGAFAERYTSNPRSEKNIFTKVDDNERVRILSEYSAQGIKYIVAEPRYDENKDRLSETMEFLDDTCEIVYASENVKIYAVP